MAGAHDGGGSASSGPGPDGKRIPSFEEVVAPSFQGPVYPQAHPAPRSIDEDAYHVTISGEPLDLTYTEFELLRYLVQHQGKVLTREVLLSKVWGYDYFGGTRTVDVHIRRLRAKLGQFDHFIGTVRNVGYRFTARWEDHDA